MHSVTVNTQLPYEVRIGSGVLPAAGELLRALLPAAEKAAVVTDDNVELLLADALEERLHAAGLEPVRIVLPHGEKLKSPENYFALLNLLAEEGFTRSDAVVALGGGAVCDLAGFAAATYQRGLPLLLAPTSLLAMADAAVGGKTAIDLPAGKNLAGAFYQPAAVLCDTDVLRTLPRPQFAEGCAELLKYAVLGDPALFALLLEQGRDFDRETVIAGCVAQKAELIAADVFDFGARRVLNLGHTVGHAVEAWSDYRISHGLAVAMGLGVAARAAAAHGDCEADCAKQIEAALERLELPKGPACGLTELLPFLLRDKKRRGATLDLILPEAIGRCRLRTLPAAEAAAYLEAGF